MTNYLTEMQVFHDVCHYNLSASQANIANSREQKVPEGAFKTALLNQILDLEEIQYVRIYPPA